MCNCRSRNKGHEIQDMVKQSGNEEWKIRLANVLGTGDLLSRDIMYHKSCRTKHWEKFIQRPMRMSQSKKNTIEKKEVEHTENFIAAEIQYFGELINQLDEGMFVDISTAYFDYKNVLTEFGLDNTNISKYFFRKKLEQNLNQVVFTPSSGNKPTQIHLSSTGKETILNEAEKKSTCSENMKNYYQTAKQLRDLIKTSRNEPWQFSGSLKDCFKSGIPTELYYFVRWLLIGTKTSYSHERI